MCDLKKWYCDERGYVFQCRDCRHFQICFGTTLLTLDEPEYHTFIQMVAEKSSEIPEFLDMPCKCIVLPTPSSVVHSLLTGDELSHLHRMLQEVDTEIKTGQLLNLFNHS